MIPFSKAVLDIDPVQETEKIALAIRSILSRMLKRRGLVIGVSGGIDSSVTLGLAVRALGPERVLALLMPERHSSPDTLTLSMAAADAYGVERTVVCISDILESLGFYERYDDAVRQVIAGYGAGWKSKIVTPDVTAAHGFSVFSIIAQSPDGATVKQRLPLKTYLEILAATNFKQRVRTMLAYYHADRRHFAVAGTPNRLEYDQGFFVKLGDGAADIKPIAHLYKTQVYQMAEYLGVPHEICTRMPTTDTYSLAQGQDEFYFSLPYEAMDLCLYGKNNGYHPEQIAPVIGLVPEQVQRVFDDIDTKRSTTRYLHMPPQCIERIPEIT
jgi:NAD+ synthase